MRLRFSAGSGTAAVIFLIAFTVAPNCLAQGSGLDFLASLIGASARVPASEYEPENWAERVIGLPVVMSDASDVRPSRQPIDILAEHSVRDSEGSALRSSLGAAVIDRFLWGRKAGLSHETFARLAALHPPLRAGAASALVDDASKLDAVGGLAVDGTRLYSMLEIEVEVSKFTLKLFGYRGDEKRLIYSTRVGLGSSEFPTPRGSFIIARIFDDKPLWIPPPDREWAIGQSPSHSVYGGHMMPLLQKKVEPRRPLAMVDNDEPDIVAPRVQIIDSGAYRVHGTDSPWSIGSSQSHGCVRMLNSTVAELANNLKIYAGTADRGVSPNGPYVNLARPVKVVLR